MDVHPHFEAQADVPQPFVIETTHRGERAWDVYSRLLHDRIVFLGTEIDDTAANLIVGQLLYLESEDVDREITLYINSPGGLITAGLAIYDTMQYVRCPVATTCFGQATAMAAVLLAAGAPGKRKALANSRVMLHQPLGGAGGQASDIEIHAREILRQRERLNEIVSHHTGRAIAQVRNDTERDRYLSALDAKEYGIVDEILRPRSAALAGTPLPPVSFPACSADAVAVATTAASCEGLRSFSA